MTNEELIGKWKMILDYTDGETPALNEFQRLYRATLMENCELDYFKYGNYPDQALFEMIGEIRRTGKLLNSPYE
jgi:hypothetical protein